ncbi:MAG TPA: hypothetical protein VFZ28_08095 [Burkholderiaceae bacterium]|nr:hypothetical protein [Burkholderiaceae bacterium]
MAAEQLLFHGTARERVRRGVDALAEAVRVTLVPWLSIASLPAMHRHSGTTRPRESAATCWQRV